MLINDQVLDLVTAELAPLVDRGLAVIETGDYAAHGYDLRVRPTRSGCCALEIGITENAVELTVGDHGATAYMFWLRSRARERNLERLRDCVRAVAAGRYREYVRHTGPDGPKVAGQFDGVSGWYDDASRATNRGYGDHLERRGWTHVTYAPYDGRARAAELPWTVQELHEMIDAELVRLGVGDAAKVEIRRDPGTPDPEAPVEIAVTGIRSGACPFILRIADLDLTLVVGDHGAKVEVVCVTERGFRRTAERVRGCIAAIVAGRYEEYVDDGTTPTATRVTGRLPDVNWHFRELAHGKATLRWDSLEAKGWRRVRYQPYSG